MKQAYYSELLKKFYLTEEDCQKAEERYNEQNKKKLEFEEEKKKAKEELNRAKKAYEVAQENYAVALQEYKKYIPKFDLGAIANENLRFAIPWWRNC